MSGDGAYCQGMEITKSADVAQWQMMELNVSWWSFNSADAGYVSVDDHDDQSW